MTHLLILAPNWLGDAVMALPAIADVRRASPQAVITVAARPAVAPMFSLVPAVQDVVVLDDEGESGLTNRGYDTALLLPNSYRAARLASRAGIPERWGYRTQWRGSLLTRAIKRPPKDLHQVEYYQHLVGALGFPNGPGAPRLDVPDAMRAAGADALARAGWNGRTPLVAIAPGAAYGGAKRWPAASYADLARALDADGVTIVMVGGPGDAAVGREVEAHFDGRGAGLLNLMGATDLPLLAGVLAGCRAVVSNDSGAMHFAAALGVRVTAVFGPTDERITGPRGEVRLKPDTTYGTPRGEVRLQPDPTYVAPGSRSVRLQPDPTYVAPGSRSVRLQPDPTYVTPGSRSVRLQPDPTYVTPGSRSVRLQPDRDPIAHAVLTHEVWCRPCMLRECPIDHRCMRVGVDAVLAEARRTL